MEIKMHLQGTTCIIVPEGQVDALTSTELTKFLEEQLADYDNLILELSKVDFISSAGLRVFLGTLKNARKKNGDLRLAAVTPDVQKVLSVSGFDRLMKIFKDVKSAVDSYSK